MALKLIKPRHHADTPGHNRRGLLSTFCDPRPLKLRKLDPYRLLKNSKWTLSDLTKVFPFNASDTVHVNFRIEIAAKASARYKCKSKVLLPQILIGVLAIPNNSHKFQRQFP